MPKSEEDKLIADAIAGTEQEIFDEATGKPERDAGAGDEPDKSLEEMGDGLEGQKEGTDADESDEDEDNSADDDADGDEDASDDADEEGEGDDKKQPDRDEKTGKFKTKDDDAEATKKAAEKDGKAEDGKGKVPSARLREETERRRAAEAERDAARQEAATVKGEVANLNKRLDDLMTAIASGQIGQQAKKADEKGAGADDKPPDMFADPDGYAAWQERRLNNAVAAVNQQREIDRVELSMQFAHERHGQAFEEAYAAVTKLDKNNPEHVQTVRRIWASPNPGRALMNWHNQVRTLAEVGEDPAKYREKIEKETREKLVNDPDFIKGIMDKLRTDAEGGDGQKPRLKFRNPPSANSARGGGMGQLQDRRPLDGSDAGVFASAFEDNA